jgi:hypothetical protein
MTVPPLVAAFTASRIASSVKMGPVVSACGSGSRTGSVVAHQAAQRIDTRENEETGINWSARPPDDPAFQVAHDRRGLTVSGYLLPATPTLDARQLAFTIDPATPWSLPARLAAGDHPARGDRRDASQVGRRRGDLRARR